MEKPRLSRLTEIVILLQSKKMITARVLSEKFKVSIRTIYRDIRSLESSGVPIITEEGKGYFLQEGYQLPPIMFSEEEANALITAEQLILKNKDTSLVDNYTNAITKIKAVLKYPQKDKADLLSKRIVFRLNKDKEKSSNYLMKLQSAITSFELLEIEYFSLQNKPTKRIVEPFAMYSTNLNWLLIAYCRLRDDFRVFRIDRIKNITFTEKKFESHNITLEEYFKICKKNRIPLTNRCHSLRLFLYKYLKNIKMNTVKKEVFYVVGISVRTTNENGKAKQDIGDLWPKFMSENVSIKISNKVDQNIYAVYTDYESDHTKPYTVILGYRVKDLENVPNGMIGKK